MRLLREIPTGIYSAAGKAAYIRAKMMYALHLLETIQKSFIAIIDYISGMTDRFAISLFNELLEY